MGWLGRFATQSLTACAGLRVCALAYVYEKCMNSSSWSNDFLSANAEFITHHADAAKRWALSDTDMADELGYSRVTIVQAKTGVTKAGPKLVRAMKELAEAGPKSRMFPDSTSTSPSSESGRMLRYIAEQTGVDELALLSRLVLKHGWAEAQLIKQERQPQRPEVKQVSRVKAAADASMAAAAAKAMKGK